MDQLEVFRWTAVDIYQSFGGMGVPLFLMLTGALLITPSKTNEDVGAFLKKRFVRVGLPFLFWGGIYFAWDVFVENQQVTQSFIVQGILTGPYLHFWYIYMLIGLYLITPFLRIIVANANQKLFKYFVGLWLVGTCLPPFLGLLLNYNINSYFFTIPVFSGYFILGTCLNMQVRRRALVALMTVGLALTALGTYVVSATIGGGKSYFFQEYVSPTMILASIPFFLLLNMKKAPSEQQPTGHTRTRKLLKVISENTLGIYFLHLIVLYLLQHGYNGVALNGNIVNSIIGVPLAAVLTLFICLAVIVALKKVPVLKHLIG